MPKATSLRMQAASASTSAPQSAMGGAGVALPTEEAAGFFYNPAHLGVFSRQGNLAVQTLPSAADWAPDILDGVTFSNTALSGGYDIEGPLSVGLGFMTSAFDYGEGAVRTANSFAVDTVDFRDRYDAFALGAGLDYLIDVSAGLTLKRVQSAPGAVLEEESRVFAFDAGVFATLPVTEAVEKAFGISVGSSEALAPFFDVSLGYAVQNVGGELDYFEDSNVTLPRTARLGYGLQAGLDLRTKSVGALRLLSAAYSFEVEDRLAEGRRDSSGAEAIRYQGPLGDIDVVQGVLLGRSSSEATRRRGVRVALAETVSLSRGRFDEYIYEICERDACQVRKERKTRGFGVRTSGLFKLLASWSNNSALAFLRDHFDLRYAQSTYNDGERNESRVRSLSLILQGF